jgi:hypothetical protein
MKRLLPFKTIAVDSRSLPAGTILQAGDRLEYFDADDHEEEEIITAKDKVEEEIIKWILLSDAKNLLLTELGVGHNAFLDYSVKAPIIENPQQKPGDIDLLICDDRRPDRAIAFQCKAVSVVAFSEDEDDVNKLPDIRKGVLQANRQRERFGFYRNYLMVIIKAYGRRRLQNNPLFRGPTPETFKEIYEFPQRESLHPDVGVVFLKIVQPTGKSFNKMVEVGVCLDQEAATLEQPPRLTGCVSEHMRRRGDLVRESS